MDPGVYERLITAGLDQQLRQLAADLVDRGRLDAADADVVLARHLGLLARRVLRSLPDQEQGDDRDLVDRQVAMANRIASTILEAAPDVATAADLVAAGEVLREVLERTGAPGPPMPMDRPEVPLGASALLVNGRDQPRIGSEVQRELASADRVDLLCAFVKWHGLRVLDEQLEELVRRRRRVGDLGPVLRVITTTYIGATERRALDRLVELGAEVKVSYETRMTRLHAKAWLFHRRSGYSTAYVGSSNLSKSALLDGLEWNVRLAEVEQGHLLDTFRATFDEYWEDPAFESYDPTDSAQRNRLDMALAAEMGGPADLPIELTSLEVRPWGPAPPPTTTLSERARRLLAMTHFSLWGWAEPLDLVDDNLERLWANPSRREEILELLAVLRDRIRRVTRPISPGEKLPLHLHARYSLAELLAAFGVQNPSTSRGAGVKWISDEQADVFWFNLRKTEKHFSPTTMYADRAISPTLFQWESQNASTPDRGAGERYIHHQERGSSVHLFFRDTKEADGDLGAPPYIYAGPATYVSHTGERPMRVIWKLDHELPADVFHAARVATG